MRAPLNALAGLTPEVSSDRRWAIVEPYTSVETYTIIEQYTIACPTVLRIFCISGRWRPRDR